jgi:hypothetical protein
MTIFDKLFFGWLKLVKLYGFHNAPRYDAEAAKLA